MTFSTTTAGGTGFGGPFVYQENTEVCTREDIPGPIASYRAGQHPAATTVVSVGTQGLILFWDPAHDFCVGLGVAVAAVVFLRGATVRGRANEAVWLDLTRPQWFLIPGLVLIGFRVAHQDHRGADDRGADDAVPCRERLGEAT